MDGVAGGPIGGVHTMCATIAVQPVWCEAARPVPTSASKHSLKTGCSSPHSPDGWSRCAPGRRPAAPGRKRSSKRCSMASPDSRLRSPCAIARLRVAAAPLSSGVGRGGVEGPVVLLEAVVVGVPQGDGEVQEAVPVGEPTQTVLTPAVGGRGGRGRRSRRRRCRCSPHGRCPTGARSQGPQRRHAESSKDEWVSRRPSAVAATSSRMALTSGVRRGRRQWVHRWQIAGGPGGWRR